MDVVAGGRHSLQATSDRQTILVVEDDIDIRGLLEEFLSDEGYQTLSAGDGLDGLHLVKSHPVDLILLDLRLPVMNAPEFCESYRECGGASPILIMTASSEADGCAAVETCQAGGVISKPFEIEELLAMIAEQLGVH